ncbi:MAG: TIGR03808 family TAT-translocated repetitive protein [Rhodopseudomonas sp.]|nr:TIGR03808 family TAT-translocated repetitive protein [Rhodopseudomonas sp.]
MPAMTVSRRHLLLGALSGAALTASPVAAQTGRPQGLDAASFGLRADSPDDQTESLQRAIDRAAQSFQPLWLGPGTYRSRALTLRASSRLIGEPGRSRIALLQGPSLLQAQGVDRVTLTGLTFDGNSVPLTQGGGLVQCSDVHGLRIVDCALVNANGNAIGLFKCDGTVTGNAIAQSADNGVMALDSRLTIRANKIANSGNGGIRVWQSVKRFDGSIVTDNTIEDTQARAGGNGQNGNGINVYRAAGVTVRDNVIRRAAFSAVRGNAASDFTVIGNDCAQFGETAMYAEFDYQNVTFVNNIIDDAANGIAVTNFDHGGHGGTVRGNVVRNIGQRVLSTLTDGSGNGFGISIEADVVASGNTIDNCAYAGLRLGFGPYLRNVKASDNTIRRSPYGIVVSVAPDAGAAVITGNRIEGATRGAIVGLAWHKAMTGDLAQGGADKFPQLTIGGNRVN